LPLAGHGAISAVVGAFHQEHFHKSSLHLLTGARTPLLLVKPCDSILDTGIYLPNPFPRRSFAETLNPSSNPAEPAPKLRGIRRSALHQGRAAARPYQRHPSSDAVVGSCCVATL
jgi:hypothetical protein